MTPVKTKTCCREFTIGKQINSLEEMMKQEYIAYDVYPSTPFAKYKIYHIGWFQNLKVRTAKQWIAGKHIYTAKKTKEE